MRIYFNKNVLDRIERLKSKYETVTQFIIYAVEEYVKKEEEKYERRENTY